MTTAFAATMPDRPRARSRVSVIAPVRNSTPANHAARTTSTAAAASTPRTLAESTSSVLVSDSGAPRVAGMVSTSSTAETAPAMRVTMSN
ncbi:hypothetical protein ACU4IU_06855 [Brevibacterium sp. CSND-B09]|uniref:hypothetical protein n=1 Tax=Brevibacterium sp. CSND-B09 TaxID=3462571 RepID=UPI00406AA755